jgi:hypothetical protein
MRNFVDFVSAPDPALLVANDVDPAPYTGNARPSQAWFDQCRAVGYRPRTMIQETYSRRAIDSGYQGGVLDCQFAESRAAQRQHTGSILYVVSDGNRVDPNDGADQIAEYGRGVSDTATLGIWGYGNEYCCAAFRRGVLAGNGAHLFQGGSMIPETWVDGTNTLLATQLVGPSPIPNTDLDIVHAEYSGATPAPAPPTEQEDSDVIAIDYYGVTHHVWVNQQGKVVYRPYHSGAPGAVLAVPGRDTHGAACDYEVSDTRPIQAGSTLYYGGDAYEVIVAPTPYGAIATVT